MTFRNSIWQNRAGIVSSFHMAILHGLHTAISRCRQNNSTPQEPDYVASLVLESTPKIFNAIRSILAPSGISVSVASVFCHQTPKVKYPSNVTCELGDILFVHVHKVATGEVNRNALLYQTKMTDKEPYKIPGNEKHQLNLYKNWPQFTYTRSGTLNGQQRNVHPKNPHTGAQYMLIDKRQLIDPKSGFSYFPGTYPIGSSIPDEYLHIHNCLANELFEFLILRTGKTFTDKKSAANTNGWSKTIWDLLDVSINKVFTRKNSKWIKTPRYAGGPIHLADGACFADTTEIDATSTIAEILGNSDKTTAFFEPPSKNESDSNEVSEAEEGISVILIETNETELT